MKEIEAAIEALESCRIIRVCEDKDVPDKEVTPRIITEALAGLRSLKEQGPFGYFNNPALDGWQSCGEHDEGAIALYEHPAPEAKQKPRPKLNLDRQAPAAKKEPDWSESETGLLECWKNPLHPMSDRLLMADGAIAFRDKTIANLRAQLQEAQAENESVNDRLNDAADVIVQLAGKVRAAQADAARYRAMRTACATQNHAFTDVLQEHAPETVEQFDAAIDAARAALEKQRG